MKRTRTPQAPGTPGLPTALRPPLCAWLRGLLRAPLLALCAAAVPPQAAEGQTGWGLEVGALWWLAPEDRRSGLGGWDDPWSGSLDLRVRRTWARDLPGPGNTQVRFGAGLSALNPGQTTSVGSPVGAFATMGIPVYRGRRVTWGAEGLLGLSVGWESYDPVANPTQDRISTGTNALLNLSTYLDWTLLATGTASGEGAMPPHAGGAGTWVLRLGLGLDHHSNGARQIPNHGLNGVRASAAIHRSTAGEWGADPDAGLGWWSPRVDRDPHWTWGGRIWAGRKAVANRSDLDAASFVQAQAVMAGAEVEVERVGRGFLSPFLRTGALWDESGGLTGYWWFFDGNFEHSHVRWYSAVGGRIGLGRVSAEAGIGYVWAVVGADPQEEHPKWEGTRPPLFQTLGLRYRITRRLEAVLEGRFLEGTRSEVVNLGLSWRSGIPGAP